MQLSQLEMVTLLCKGDTTHSQLMELMPERCGTDQSRDFEAILAEVIGRPYLCTVSSFIDLFLPLFESSCL